MQRCTEKITFDTKCRRCFNKTKLLRSGPDLLTFKYRLQCMDGFFIYLKSLKELLRHIWEDPISYLTKSNISHPLWQIEILFLCERTFFACVYIKLPLESKVQAYGMSNCMKGLKLFIGAYKCFNTIWTGLFANSIYSPGCENLPHSIQQTEVPPKSIETVPNPIW